MTTRSKVVHGGDVWQIAAEYGIDASSLLDYSANINPRGLPLRASLQLQSAAADQALLSRYPDPSYSELCTVLARQIGVSQENILIGEGAEALLGSVIRAVSPARCLVPVPAFSEYARACTAANSEMEVFKLDPAGDFHLDCKAFARKLRDERFDCVILNNPHNPSGAVLESSEMIGLVSIPRQSRGL